MADAVQWLIRGEMNGSEMEWNDSEVYGAKRNENVTGATKWRGNE